jgi:hypothetical protein
MSLKNPLLFILCVNAKQMETVQIKYDNFRKFGTDAAPPGSFWLSLMASVLLDTFLRGIYERVEAEPGLTL